jgi:hypothetical protein
MRKVPSKSYSDAPEQRNRARRTVCAKTSHLEEPHQISGSAEERAWPSRQRTNTSPPNCTIARAGSPTAGRVALAGDIACTGMPTGTTGHACDPATLARPLLRRAPAMRLLLRRLRPDMLRAHHGTVSKLTVLANSSLLKEELDKRARCRVFLFSRNYHEPSCN